jgi:hypothetical protein
MLEALRGLGYTTSTAIADIIDNSLSAGATTVSVHFEWAGATSWIRVLDDGRGMDDAELEDAMRLGARDPREPRDASDLGRFGMGLKTASFSQARRLTVASRKKGGEIACLRWDLSRLGLKDDDWSLHEGPEAGSEPHLEPLQRMDQGTIVLWEDLDRIVSEGFTAQDMIELADAVEAHLAMTFHRLIGDSDDAEFTILLNGRKVKPWDPMLTGHPGKALESVQYSLLQARGIRVQCHVLPHKDLLSRSEFESAAGPAGWTSQQGFYIYRNKRLLVAGGWLGLGERGRKWTRDEPHRLARIRLDIPNSADADWKINDLKSTASPPLKLRRQLTRLGAETRETARRVFAHRGRLETTTAAGGLPDIWAARKATSGISYRILREHDLVASILERAGPLRPDLIAMLRLIEETVPVQRIWLDTAEQNETPRCNFETAPSD